MTKLSYPKNRIRVLLLENIHPVAKEYFTNEGYQIESLQKSLSEDELMDRISDISILGIRSNTKLTPKVFARAKHLLAVGAYCIGTNQIDISAANNAGVAIFNAPYSNTRSVVELTLANILALSRHLIDTNNRTHQGIWSKSAHGNHEIRGQVLGIIGYGHIGSQLSVVAESLGMHVIYYDCDDKLSYGNARSCSTMGEVLGQADIVTIHVDGRPENANLIGAEEFKHMKQGSLFLNLSRGMVVDTTALADALRSGHLSGAAVDVYPSEPKSANEPLQSDLCGLPNTILTPHVASGTEEAQCKIGKFVSKKLMNFINTGNSVLSVNIPNMLLPQLHDAHRLLHIHRNVPGVLAHVNDIITQSKANIVHQYLSTNTDIGYVITDIDERFSKTVQQNIDNLPETLRTRLLY